MARAASTVFLILALAGQAGWQHRGRGTWDYVTDDGKIAAFFIGYAADPGDALATLVSFDHEGNPWHVERIWYLGMDNAGLSLLRQSSSVTEAMKAAYRKHLNSFKAESHPRLSAAVLALANAGADVERSEFRLPPPPVVYRLPIRGASRAETAKNETESSHLRIAITVSRDTTLVANVAGSRQQ